MWNEPSKEQLDKLPRLYETEDVPLKDKLIHIHFFLGGCEWYIVEYDGEDLFFGYTILNNDYDNGEWGYISFKELKEITLWPGIEVEFDLYWTVCKASQIYEIRIYGD